MSETGSVIAEALEGVDLIEKVLTVFKYLFSIFAPFFAEDFFTSPKFIATIIFGFCALLGFCLSHRIKHQIVNIITYFFTIISLVSFFS